KEQFVYFFYVVTNPIGRYILEAPFDPTQLGKLNTSSIMGLLKVDASKAQQMQDMIGKMQGASKGKGLAFGSLKDIGSTLQKTFMGPREPEKDKKAKPMQLDPNDPLYFATYGKKVSKVAERMKKVAANPLSTGMRMGGGELGGGGTDAIEEMKAKDP